MAASSRAHSFNADAYWVGDLTVNYTLQVHTAGEFATVKFALLEGPDTMLCEIRLTDGTAKLTRINRRTDRDGDHPQTVASGKTPVRGRGTWRIAFANVDNRLLLWVNDESVDFDGSTNIDQNFVDALATLPEPTDVAPCGIAVQGVNATVSELLLERDIYYRNDAMVPQEPTTYRQNPYDVWTPEAPRTQTHEEVASPSGLHRDLAYSNHWAEHYASAASLAHDKYGSYTEYCLADDEYLMLGDNSPRSKDSRLFDWYNRPKWDIRGNRCAVKEKDLIGRALFVFWPHGVPFLNDGKGFTLRKHRYYDGSEVKEVHDYPLHRIPFYPNVSRMKKIR